MEVKNELLTPQEVADYLKVDVRTIYRWLNTGTMAGVKIGDNWRILKSTIDNYFINK